MSRRPPGIGSNASSGGGGAPSGSAGGSLAGTYPNPTIAASAITTTELLDGTVAIADMTQAASERAIILGKGGVVGATETDNSDVFFICPFNGTFLRMKSVVKTAASGAMAVQLRTATGPITSTITWANVTSFVTTFSNGNYVAVVDPANVNFAEGDLVGFSVSTGSGANLLVEVVVVPR